LAGEMFIDEMVSDIVEEDDELGFLTMEFVMQ
jgi:hypothetical protein